MAASMLWRGGGRLVCFVWDMNLLLMLSNNSIITPNTPARLVGLIAIICQIDARSHGKSEHFNYCSTVERQ